ncbi:hypothetical protein R1flu_025240 [Riccia fluitans]|uniref:Uncharacterized protein n=1 Tax=Riccia fluitans TaxID=41844 RepID=A0ABD1XY33_9MARC
MRKRAGDLEEEVDSVVFEPGRGGPGAGIVREAAVWRRLWGCGRRFADVAVRILFVGEKERARAQKMTERHGIFEEFLNSLNN